MALTKIRGNQISTATNATVTVAVPPDTAAGIATVNIQPSVSLGLVIALGA